MKVMATIILLSAVPVQAQELSPFIRAEQICEQHVTSRPPEEHWLSHWDTFEAGWENCNKIAKMADGLEGKVNRAIDMQRHAQEKAEHSYVDAVGAGKIK